MMCSHNKTAFAAIFDVDGTLVDSMAAWRASPKQYLDRYHISCELDLAAEFDRRGFVGVCHFLAERFPVCGTSEQIQNAIMDGLTSNYRVDFPQIAHAKEYLKKLRDDGVKICVLTANLRELVEPSLERLGMTPYFLFVMSCQEEKLSKSDPALFRLCAQHLGVDVQHCVMFEDQVRSIQSAKQAGMRAVGIRDRLCPQRQEGLSLVADRVIDDYAALLREDIFQHSEERCG